MLWKASTPASGVRKFGIPRALRCSRAGFTLASPIQQPSTGLAAGEKPAPTARATASGSPPALGEWISSTPSAPRSFSAASSAAR